MKTYSQKPSQVTRQWHLVDAAQLPLGRLASVIARLLTGKGKTTFTPHTDGGDYVVVINAAQLVVTGKKMENKVYYRHSNYPGGLKQVALKDQISKDPTVVISQAVRGMLPVNKLRPARLERLKVYSGAEHPHEAQQPAEFNLKAGK